MIKNKSSKINIKSFSALKQSGTKITMMTAYDYSMARCVAKTDTDIILVGDSLGMVVLGFDSTLKVSIDDMVYHAAAVRRGAPDSFIIADMPYMSYHLSEKKTKQNASRLIIDGMANAVKLEGGNESRCRAISSIVDCEIPVCAHLGLTPQSIHRFGGYKVQGKSDEAYQLLLQQALAVEKAGAFLLVLEGIPELLAQEISNTCSIPTIGIGAGRYTDGQVLVYHDLLGYSGSEFKFVKKYANLEQSITEALSAYCSDVRNAVFPALEHIYYPIKQDE